jgi:chromosome partitioning protein
LKATGEKMGKIIVFVNEKGGVGKSSFTHALSRYLRAHNRSCLLIDSDPQATTSDVFIHDDFYDNTAAINLATAIATEKIENFIVPTIYEGIHLVPANIKLSDYRGMGTWTLRNLIEPIKEKYDYILIDSPGSFDNFLLNVVGAADIVLLPTTRDQTVVAATKATIEMLIRDMPYAIDTKLIKVFLNDILVRKSKRVNRITEEHIWEIFNEYALRHTIPQNGDLADMVNTGAILSRAKSKIKLFLALTDLFDEVTGLDSTTIDRF